MKLSKLFVTALIVLSINQCVYAENVNETHQSIIKRYVNDLQTADYKDIVQLFEKNGIVISTSHGEVNAKEFFTNFLPNIQTAETQLQQVYENVADADRSAARFHLSFVLKDGESSDGEYMDEFVFSKNSNKLTAVYMFENLKFPK